MAAHKIPYVATASVAYPLDFVAKVKKASGIKGLKYIHLHAPCPTGWRFPSDTTIEIGRLAVLSGMWALYEIESGVFRLTGVSRGLIDTSKRRPIEDYLKLQGRFSKISEEQVKLLQRHVDEIWAEYERLMRRG